MAAIAVACAAIPYCLARAIQSFAWIDAIAAIREEQKTQTRLLASVANNADDQTSRLQANQLATPPEAPAEKTEYPQPETPDAGVATSSALARAAGSRLAK